MKNKMLSQSIADNILSMITIEKRFSVGNKQDLEQFTLEQRNAEGAKNAMRIHIMHAIKELNCVHRQDFLSCFTTYTHPGIP